MAIIPLQKLTWFFNQGKNGWSETWYLQALTIAAAMAVAKKLAPLRAAVLASDSFIEATRIIDMNAPGAADLDVTLFRGDQVIWQNSSNAPAPYSLLYRMQDASLQYRRQFWIHGVASAQVTLDFATGQPIFPAKADGLIQKFITAASKIPNPLGILAWNKSVPPATVTGITAVAASANLGFTTITAPNHGAVTGQKVRLRKIAFTNPQQLPEGFKINGVWTVTNVTLNTFDVAVPFPGQIVNVVYTGTGLVQLHIQTFIPMATGEFLRFATRRTGRAFFVPAGRRSRPR